MREMKDSGIAWIGEIPADWQIKRIGHLFQNRNEKVNDTDYPPLSVSKGGIVPQMENVAKSDANDNRKMVCVNDFVINSRSDRKQSCGVSSLDGSVSLINTVLYAFLNNGVNPLYNNYLLKNYGFAEEFYRWGHGIVADLWTTRWQEMKSIELPIPSKQEQELILADIDKQSKKVDALIANQEQQIDKLKAYKQSLITEVVTKGLNPDAPMKPSCVEWIGEIPESWEVYPLKLSFAFGKGLPITKADLTPTGIKVISYGQIHAKYNSTVNVDDRLYRYVSDSYLESNASSLVSKNDMIFADTSEDVEGAGNFVFIDRDDTIFAGYHTLILKSLRDADNRYLAFLFMSNLWKNQVQSLVKGIKVYSVTRSILSNTTYILPTEQEQQQIVEYLDEKCSKIDRLVEIKQQKIDKLNDYKKSLIYEYVTGKKEA